MTKRNKRIIKVLESRINSLYRILEEIDNEHRANIYIGQVGALRSCIGLLTDEEYLKNMEIVYNKENRK